MQHEDRIPAAGARLQKPMLIADGWSHENQPTRKQSSMYLLGCVGTLLYRMYIHDTADTEVRTDRNARLKVTAVGQDSSRRCLGLSEAAALANNGRDNFSLPQYSIHLHATLFSIPSPSNALFFYLDIIFQIRLAPTATLAHLHSFSASHLLGGRADSLLTRHCHAPQVSLNTIVHFSSSHSHSPVIPLQVPQIPKPGAMRESDSIPPFP